LSRQVFAIWCKTCPPLPVILINGMSSYANGKQRSETYYWWSLLLGFLLALAYQTVAQNISPVHSATSSHSGAKALAAQVHRGENQYASNCAMCHAQDLSGLDPAPALTGDKFMRKWQGKAIWDLYDKIRKTMPQNDRGGLKSRVYVDIVAYLAKFNDINIGKRELRDDQNLLKSIPIAKSNSQ